MSEERLVPEESVEQAAPPGEVPPPAPVVEVVPAEAPPAPRRLMRSRRDRVIAGVCGGLGRYFGVDPVLIRALWVFLTLVTWGAGGVLLYLLAMLVMPEAREEEPVAIQRMPIQGNVFWGGLLILAGLFFLVSTVAGRFIPSWVWGMLQSSAIALVLIAAGLLIIFGISRRNGGARRLVRSRRERMIAGVCGGVAAYFQIDPTWVRLIWIVVTLLSVGIGAVLYVVAMLAIPDERRGNGAPS